MLVAYKQLISLEERNRVNKLEMFDEIEEWELLMSHYSITVAVKGETLGNVVDIVP